jgi:hypothetical protein
MAGQQGQFDMQAVAVEGTAETLPGFAYPVLDGVLMQVETLGRRLVAAILREERTQCLAQPGAVLVVRRQRP